MEHDVALNVNGKIHRLRVPVTATLVDVLRDRLGLTGTHKDCCMGICGSCTVLLDGRPVSSCLLLSVQADGAAITTIEGLEGDGRLHALQEAFLTHAAVQCGYCTPGFVLTAKALLDETSTPTREEVVSAFEGNLCRCTGYVKIVEAVLAASATAERGSGRQAGAKGN
jgi:carbon-monoxide dehydrogenase small subunit